MKITLRTAAACALLTFLFALVPAWSAGPPMPLDSFPKSSLAIATPDARLHRFNIYIANDDARRQQGLMFVKDLPSDVGMLFLYSNPHRVGIWMKNTLIPLDILFIRADGRVSSIEANAKPLTLDTMESKEDVVAVLELKGGTAASLNIRKGAIVMHKAFGTTAQ